VRLPIETERLVLRSLRPGDEQDVFAYRSLPDVARYIPGDPKTRDDVADLVAEQATAGRIETDTTRAKRVITLAVEADGRVVGDVMFRLGGPDGVDGQQAEIGWVFSPEVAGKGYATEAAAALVKVAFDELGLHRVWAQLDARNDASARLCDRLGMTREALFVQGSWFKDEWTDLAIHAIRADQWREHPDRQTRKP
jgi:aminoglycoside 6'-N-acetyltransferase